jgi:hypothetical protein
MSTATARPLAVEVARETDAIELAEFARRLGLAATCEGSTVRIDAAHEDIGCAVTSWLAQSHAALVPAGRSSGKLVLRPPSD